MIILIEDAETLKFLSSNGRWTTTLDEGATFPSAQAASAAAKNEPIGKFNIVRYFGDTNQFINLDHGAGKGH